MKARIREIFCSFQGEGKYLGVRQVFIRFQACNIACNYCDTRLSFKGCRVERTPGKGDFYFVSEHLSPEEVEQIVKNFGRVHSYSLTGGEPLLEAEFIRELKIEPLYLESNMTLPEQAEKIKDKVRFVAGDFKLSFAFENFDLREQTIKTFKILRNTSKRDTFAKFVVAKDVNWEEVYESLDAIKKYISLAVLQPVTPLEKAPPLEELMENQRKLMELAEVRIVPQTHKFLKAL